VGEIDLGPATVREIRRMVGLVFQDPDDQLFMPSVGEDVAFGPANAGMSGTELDARVDEALAEVDALHLKARPPHHLSGGERRRAALATVLSMRPGILVLDEPTSGLDPAGRRELIGVLESLSVTQLVITHDLPLALELCPRAVIMDGGQVVADGPTPRILADQELLAAHRLEMPYGFVGPVGSVGENVAVELGEQWADVAEE
jgi:cobalt/nickel transport system ATP-binding protein